MVPGPVVGHGGSGKIVRTLDEAAMVGLEASAQTYMRNWKRFMHDLEQIEAR